MIKYSLKRLGRSLITLVIVITIVFCLLRLMPIEGYFSNFDKLSEAQLKAGIQNLGLNDPIYVQLGKFFTQLLRGDLGVSNIYRVNVPIADILAQKAPVSIYMGLASLAIAMILGIPLGMAMARKKHGWWDKIGTAFIVFIQAVPSAVYYLFIQLYGTDFFGLPMLFKIDNPMTWILPTISLSLGSVAYYAMWLRRYMVDESNKDYVKLARAKGVPEKQIMSKHIFRNAFVPMIQYLPNSILFTMMGSIYVESLYSVPGMGGLLVDVIQRQDNTMVQAIVIIYAMVSIVGLLLGDLLMAAFDPRINLKNKGGAR